MTQGRHMGIGRFGVGQGGVFITFEGSDGVGKSTHIRFLADKLAERGYETVCLREPGGTELGERLRALLLDPAYEGISAASELLMYETARAQLVFDVIEPALERGAIVLCDRFFDSTVAYQVFGRGLDRDFVESANMFASRGIKPHRTLLLTLGEVEDGLSRVSHRDSVDRLEREDVRFHERVLHGFRTIAAEEPERVRVIDSSGSRSITAALVFYELSDLFSWMGDPDVCTEAYFQDIESE